MNCYVLIDKGTVDLLYKEGEKMQEEIDHLREENTTLKVNMAVAKDFLEESEIPFYKGLEVLNNV
jgi:hypothetical protein